MAMVTLHPSGGSWQNSPAMGNTMHEDALVKGWEEEVKVGLRQLSHDMPELLPNPQTAASLRILSHSSAL